MIFNISATSGVDRVKRSVSKIELTKAKRRAGQRNPVCGDVRLKCDNLFAPRNCLPFTGELRRFRHDATGRGVLRIELEHVTRDEHSALIITLRKKLLCLLGKMLFAPDCVTA